MEKIIRTHEKVLDHLIRLRNSDTELFFVPRKINNRKRLEKGYWFIGNEYYLNVSFWNGMDWKEKMHNIGFVILNDNNASLEFSAQDSKDKAVFLKKVVDKIGGFKKDTSKNKWYKEYSNKDFLKNLDDFIANEKPIIDDLISKEKPEGIYLLNKEFYNKYTQKVIKLRQKQISFGNKNKLARICWNKENWKFPSGSQGKSVSVDAYESDTGFGHEEWLFDKSRIIESYHYAFIQPLYLKTNKHDNKIYNISLFTINNLNKRYYVGEIKNVECITKAKSRQIYQIYKSNGWIDEMRADVEKVGANYEKLKSTDPQIFFNIRFKFKDVIRPDDLIEIDVNDINITSNRYKLLPKKSELILGTINEEDESEGNKKSTSKRKKVFNSECEYDPYHDQMQNAIFELLKTSKKYDYKKVFIEKGRVDIKAITKNGIWHYFELKTDNPKQSIRQALGQIMEYAYFPDLEKAEKLIIVADEEPNNKVMKYLKHIRDKFNLPITYRFFNLETNELSNDY